MFLAEYDRWGYCDSKNDKEFWNINSPKGIYSYCTIFNFSIIFLF